ncbi:unnamed protein product [Urochloa humidicola]
MGATALPPSPFRILPSSLLASFLDYLRRFLRVRVPQETSTATRARSADAGLQARLPFLFQFHVHLPDARLKPLFILLFPVQAQFSGTAMRHHFSDLSSVHTIPVPIYPPNPTIFWPRSFLTQAVKA